MEVGPFSTQVLGLISNSSDRHRLRVSKPEFYLDEEADEEVKPCMSGSSVDNFPKDAPDGVLYYALRDADACREFSGDLLMITQRCSEVKIPWGYSGLVSANALPDFKTERNCQSTSAWLLSVVKRYQGVCLGCHNQIPRIA